MKRKFSHFLPFFSSILFFLLLNTSVFGQDSNYYTPVDSLFFSTRTDSLKKLFHFCSNIPRDYEVAFYTALSHYPELQQTPIKFIQKSLKTTMATRPSSHLFSNRRLRGYRIYANNKVNFSGVYLKNLHFNQQLGIIGHELAHILDYSKKSTFRLIGNGIAYLFPAYRRKMEAATDMSTIKHGLGWQLYDFVDYLLNRSQASENYKKMKRRIYLDDQEIKAILQKP